MKERVRKSKAQPARHDPLHLQIASDIQVTDHLSQTGRGASRRERVRGAGAKPELGIDDENEAPLDARMSQKIRMIAREQLRELRDDQDQAADAASDAAAVAAAAAADAMATEDFEEAEEVDEDDEASYRDAVRLAESQISESERNLLEQFMPSFGARRAAPRTIADLIMEKLESKKSRINKLQSTDDETPLSHLDDKVVEVYSSVGNILSRYRSGKVPKAFKIIPTLTNWEEVLYLTRPDDWTPNALFQATRLFASSFNPKMAQRFFNVVLLPRVRYEFTVSKKINFHIYMSLRKALYKPAAFFKGILIPLCESNDCTLREAAVIGSVLAKSSVPSLHSAVAILRIADMEYSGVNSLLLRVLLDKKYALPYRVIDSLVLHFIRFTHDDRQLPVLWHQSLLVFIQRYKGDMTTEQRDLIMALLRKHSHPGIGPEIRREILESRSREEREAASNEVSAAGFEDMFADL
ncbi:hypothetical protein H696_01604 [Fonticula alba]|uniref:Bystin n=1 Tax=Fonticula alba TaxID=691883 RepID=A0A058ZCR7_FONAL|nr:hypothetical protein H696_01604 [Fonticula alba]KCV72205.1 hypothetical protein H696_01604 [Fonticula alba]|eukprot:XP_009493783.1 hypothetical protein H696_01604 [Fonticula alba]